MNITPASTPVKLNILTNTNPINGPTMTLINEKIKRFQSYTKDETYKSSMVEMII